MPRLSLSGTLDAGLAAALVSRGRDANDGAEALELIVHGLGAPEAAVSMTGAVNASIVGPAVELLERVAQRAAARVMLLSDLDVLGRAVRLPMDVFHPVAPLHEAAAARAAVEHIARAYIARGVDLVIVRSSALVGPGVEGEFAGWAGLLSGDDVVLEDPDARVDVVDVRDLAAGVLVVGAAGQRGATYHLCSGRAVARAQLLARLAPDVVVTRARGTARPPVVLGDPARAEALGWRRAFTLEDGLRAMRPSG